MEGNCKSGLPSIYTTVHTLMLCMTTPPPPPTIPVHCGCTRQTASIISMDRDNLRTGDKAICRFQFIKNPEYLRMGTRMVFREGRTKAIGTVIRVFPDVPAPPVVLASKTVPSLQHQTSQPRSRGRRRGRGNKGPALVGPTIADVGSTASL